MGAGAGALSLVAIDRGSTTAEIIRSCNTKYAPRTAVHMYHTLYTTMNNRSQRHDLRLI